MGGGEAGGIQRGQWRDMDVTICDRTIMRKYCCVTGDLLQQPSAPYYHELRHHVIRPPHTLFCTAGVFDTPPWHDNVYLCSVSAQATSSRPATARSTSVQGCCQCGEWKQIQPLTLSETHNYVFLICYSITGVCLSRSFLNCWISSPFHQNELRFSWKVSYWSVERTQHCSGSLEMVKPGRESHSWAVSSTGHSFLTSETSTWLVSSKFPVLSISNSVFPGFVWPCYKRCAACSYPKVLAIQIWNQKKRFQFLVFEIKGEDCCVLYLRACQVDCWSDPRDCFTCETGDLGVVGYCRLFVLIIVQC